MKARAMSRVFVLLFLKSLCIEVKMFLIQILTLSLNYSIIILLLGLPTDPEPSSGDYYESSSNVSSFCFTFLKVIMY